jgi:hypothetical protein
MTRQTVKDGASCGVPEPDGLVATGGGKDVTVGAQIQAVDVPRMTDDRDGRLLVRTA